MSPQPSSTNFARQPVEHRLVSAIPDRDEALLLIFGADGEDAPTSNLGPISPVAVTRAMNFVDGSGVVPQLELWHEEFTTKLRGNRARAGRRGQYSIRLLLILFMITLLDGKSPQTKNVAQTVRRLSDLDRRRLGIAAEIGETEDALYHRVTRAFRGWIDSLDPYPAPRRATLSTETHQRLTEQENSDVNTEIMLARLDWFANHLLEASFHALPRQYREQWRGNIAVDATLIKVHGQRGTNVHKGRTSHDRDAGHYVRPGSHDGDAGGVSKKEKRYNGYEATIAVILPNRPGERALFPPIAIGMGFHRPGKEPGIEAANCSASVRHRGHPAGLWLGDLAYTDARREKLRRQLKGLDYDMVLDLKPAKKAAGQLAAGGLGINGSYKGVTRAVGKHYCPAMPKALLDRAPHIGAGLMDRSADPLHRRALLDEWQRTLARMAAYEIKPKARPKPGGPMVARCPAIGANATVRCPLRPVAEVPEGRVLLPIRVADLPEHEPEICTNKESVSIPFIEWADEYQAFAWKSPEWVAHYGMCSIVEGYNGYIKNEGAQHMSAGGRRPQRGQHVQYVIAALHLAVANLAIIQKFLLKPPAIPARALARPAVATSVEQHEWSVPLIANELSEDSMQRRREILDSRSGEDVKAAKRKGDLVLAEELKTRRDAMRRRPPGSSVRTRMVAS